SNPKVHEDITNQTAEGYKDRDLTSACANNAVWQRRVDATGGTSATQLRPWRCTRIVRSPTRALSACAFGMTVMREGAMKFYAAEAIGSADTSRNSDHATSDWWIRSRRSP